MSKLALLGGSPVLAQPLAPYQSMGTAETEAVCRVMASGVLSGFYGSAGELFFGGPQVRAFEQAWGTRFSSRFVVSMNSATSGLMAAMGAIGLSPGEEVIVPPYTMSAGAMAPLVYGGIPVFVDIEPDTFCLDVDAVRDAIGPRTRAIIAVNLFGHPARLRELRQLAEAKGLSLVEDNAQGMLADEGGRNAGTIGHIGVFSLNYHKHIHAGEGGVCVTDDERLAERLRLIRNHGENVVSAADHNAALSNIIGFNFRLPELSAAIALEQLARIDEHVERRERIGRSLTAAVADLEGLTPPMIRSGCRHAFYVWAVKVDETELGISRALLSRALAAEGFPHFVGYVAPLYRLPLFSRRIAIGAHGYPFTLSNVTYPPKMCAVTERMHERELLGFECCLYAVGDQEVEALGEAIRKVHSLRDELRASIA